MRAACHLVWPPRGVGPGCYGLCRGCRTRGRTGQVIRALYGIGSPGCSDAASCGRRRGDDHRGSSASSRPKLKTARTSCASASHRSFITGGRDVRMKSGSRRHSQKVEGWAKCHSSGMAAVVQPAGTVTLVFTDIEGSTRLLAELGEVGYRDALAEHREVVRGAFGRSSVGMRSTPRGTRSSTRSSLRPARECGREAISALEGGLIAVRVGVHTGEPGLDPPKYVGRDVHTAARIMSAGHGGQVAPSRARTTSSRSVRAAGLGEHRAKDLSSAPAAVPTR